MARLSPWRSVLAASRRGALACALGLAVALGAGATAGEEAWRPLFAEDGVSVQERADPGLDLPEFRGVVEIGADLYEIFALILDVPAQTTWLWRCRESRVLAREGDAAVFYQRLAAPWPGADRDVVLRGEARVVDAGRRLAVSFHSEEHAAAPPVPGLVRVPRLEGEFELVAVEPTRTRVTYTLRVDPGGRVPFALARGSVRASPFHTLIGLRRRVAETRGRYAADAERWRARR